MTQTHIHCSLCTNPIETADELEQVTLGSVWHTFPDSPNRTPEENANCPSVMTCELVSYHTACLQWRIDNPKQHYSVTPQPDDIF